MNKSHAEAIKINEWWDNEASDETLGIDHAVFASQLTADFKCTVHTSTDCQDEDAAMQLMHVEALEMNMVLERFPHHWPEYNAAKEWCSTTLL